MLHARNSNASGSLIVGAIKNVMSLTAVKTVHINLCWVSGHCGIAGNDKADTKVKFASNKNVDELRRIRAIPHTDMTGIVKAAARREWQREWSSAEYHDTKLREVKPEIGNWSSLQLKQKNRDGPDEVTIWTHQFNSLIACGKMADPSNL